MIKNITVIGAGTMGRGIAHTFSRHGYKVCVYEPFEGVRVNATQHIRAELQFLVDEGYITGDEFDTACNNITLHDNLEDAAANADYVIEACPEDLGLKQRLFGQLDKICPPGAVFATNTSSLRLDDIMQFLPPERKKRCMVSHWYNPPHLMPIAELSKFGNMDEALFTEVYELYVECKKQPVCVLKDIPGMVANRLMHALAREAFYLMEIGAASPEDVDRALMYGPGFRSATTGLLEVADMGGLDIWLAALDVTFPALNADNRAGNTLRGLVAQGDLGVKTGKGFFEYPEGERKNIHRDFCRRLLVQLKASEHYKKERKNGEDNIR